MKTTRTFLILLLATLLSLTFAATSFAAIADTAHDLSADGYGSDQICIFCHTPHNANDTYEPLWNADISTTASFTAYSSSTFDGTVADGLDPVIGPSRLCMSCHDGSIAIDSAIGSTTLIGDVGTGSGLLDTDLSNDHPVGFDYVAAALADDEIEPATATLGTGFISDYLFDNGSGNTMMTCATCHDVHGVTGVASFLLETNAGSALCLRCHIK